MRRRCAEGYDGEACLLKEVTGSAPAEGYVFVYAALELTLDAPFASEFEAQEAQYALQQCGRRSAV